MTELLVIAMCLALVFMVGSLARAASIRSFAKDLEFQIALERSGDLDAVSPVAANSAAALQRFEATDVDNGRSQVDDR